MAGIVSAIEEKPILTYFPIASRGETARLICAVGELEFEDNATGALKDGMGEPKDFFSPKSVPMLKHGDLQMAQSLPVEAYLLSICPKFKNLTPQQRAIDGVVCAIKEDVNAGMASRLFKPAPTDGGEDVKKFLTVWYGIIEHKCPESGFFNGFDFPTGADLACLVMTEGYMPFGAMEKQAGLEPCAFYKTFPKLAALVKRVQDHPVVAEYYKASKGNLKSAAFGK